MAFLVHYFKNVEKYSEYSGFPLSIILSFKLISDDRERKKRQIKRTSNEAKPSTSVTIKIESEMQNEVGTSMCVDNPQEDRSDTTPYGRVHGFDMQGIFSHPPKEALPDNINIYYKMSDEETALLTIITDAYKVTMLAHPTQRPGGYNNATDLINQSELVVRKLITFVKHLDDFRNLSQEDQIAILKSCVMNSILLRSALFYDVEKDAWLTSKDDYIPSSILKSLTGLADLHNTHVAYCRKLKTLAGSDLKFYALMQVPLFI